MKISVALCTCNGAKYVGAQLESIVSQTFQADEIIICDDRSNDGTVPIIKGILTKKYSGDFKIHINDRTLGTIKNFEKTFLLATGDIIFLSDQDDVWYPNKIETMTVAFKSQPASLLIFSDGDLITESGATMGSKLWDKWEFTAEMRRRWTNNRFAFNDLLKNNNKVTGATVAFKSELKKYILPIEPPYGYWHDAWIALHAAALNGLSFIEKALIQYRIHPSQQIGLPKGSLSSTTVANFCECVSNEEFYAIMRERYPNLMPKKTWSSVIRMLCRSLKTTGY